jgi:tripartite-type tricarboxylate transporter receptor subunit TctC
MRTGRTGDRSRRTFLLTAATAIGAAVGLRMGTDRARAAEYPDHPIRIIVPFAPAGPTDIMARILASSLGAALNGTVVVENRSGAGGNIGIGIAARGDPDGLCAHCRAWNIAQCDPGQPEDRAELDRGSRGAGQGPSQ